MRDLLVSVIHFVNVLVGGYMISVLTNRDGVPVLSEGKDGKKYPAFGGRAGYSKGKGGFTIPFDSSESIDWPGSKAALQRLVVEAAESGTPLWEAIEAFLAPTTPTTAPPTDEILEAFSASFQFVGPRVLALVDRDGRKKKKLTHLEGIKSLVKEAWTEATPADKALLLQIVKGYSSEQLLAEMTEYLELLASMPETDDEEAIFADF